MVRLWAVNAGPDGKRTHSKGIAGTEKENAELMRKGFDPAPSSGNGDFAYYSPVRGLIWLFPDNTWFGERIAPGSSLKAYLDTVPDVEIDEQDFHVVQTEGRIPNDLGTMSGVELTAYIRVRISDDAEIAKGLSELGNNGSVKIEYISSFGLAAHLEIKRLLFKPDAPKSDTK